jgi:hypothetical protein
MQNTATSKHLPQLVGALLAAWEATGHTIGVDQHLKIRQLLQILPANTALEKLPTLLAPILASSQQEQAACYLLFEQCFQSFSNELAENQHRVANALKTAQKEARWQAWYSLKKDLIAAWNRFATLANTHPGVRMSMALGLLLIFAGIIWHQWNKRQNLVQSRYEFLLPAADSMSVTQRNCFKLQRQKVKIDRGFTIQPARRHQVLVDLNDRELCIQYQRLSPGIDTLIYDLRAEDGTQRLVQFIFQENYAIFNLPSTDHPMMLGPAGLPVNNNQRATNTPALSPIDSNQMLFDTAFLVQKPSQYSFQQSSHWRFGTGFAYFNPWKWGLIVLFAFILLGIGYWRRRKQQQITLKHSADLTSPYTWNIQVPNSGDLQQGESFYKAATEMRQRQEGAYQRLDVPATLNATVKQAGMIQFRFQKIPASKAFLVLIDLQSPQNHHARLFQARCYQWKLNEAPIEIMYYSADPRFCWGENFPAGIQLADLYAKYPEHRLILWGTGDELIGLRGNSLQAWCSVFNQWRSRVLLTPMAPVYWDKRADILAQQFRLLPDNHEGISMLVETLEALEPKSHTLLKTDSESKDILLPWIPKVTGRQLIQLLEALLVDTKNGQKDDRLMRWVAACAIPPILFWDWTLQVGEKLSTPNDTFLHADHLSRILTLPWFENGKMPIEVQATLLQWLETNHPVFLERMRREWDQVMEMEENIPPVGSIAWENHRLYLLLNRLKLQEKKKDKYAIENELDKLVSTGIHEHGFLLDVLEKRAKTIDNILSDRFRKFVQVKHGLFWRWRDWVWQLPLWLLLVAGTAMVHYTEPVRTFRVGAFIKSLAISADNRYLAIGSGDHKVNLWSMEGPWIRGKEGYRDQVLQIDFAADQTSVMTGTADHFIAFWDIWGQELMSLQRPSKLISAYAFSADKKTAIIASYETGKGLISILNTENNTVLASFEAHQEAITDIALAPTGDVFVTSSRDKTLKCWRMDGTLQATFTGHTDIVHATCFSPDGQYVFSASRDNTARMWDRQGTLLQIYRGHKSDVYDICCAPDQQSILTASADQTARLWNLDGRLIRVLEGHYEPIRVVRYAPDGSLLATGSMDGTVKVWKY